MNVAEVGLKRVIGSWNSHSIDGVYHILVVWLRITWCTSTARSCFSDSTLKLIKYNHYNITTLLYFLGKDNRIPDVVARATRRIRPLTPTIVPSVQNAIQMYTNAGGVLTSECSFGNDPLADDWALSNRRDAEFAQNNPSFSQIFENVIIGNGALMETAILSFINITRYLSPWSCSPQSFCDLKGPTAIREWYISLWPTYGTLTPFLTEITIRLSKRSPFDKLNYGGPYFRRML